MARNDVLERIVAEAQRLARVRGSETLQPEDVFNAAAKSIPSREHLPGKSPADEDPSFAAVRSS